MQVTIVCNVTKGVTFTCAVFCQSGARPRSCPHVGVIDTPCLQEKDGLYIKRSTHRGVEVWDHEDMCQTRQRDSVWLLIGWGDTRSVPEKLAWVWEVAPSSMSWEETMRTVHMDRLWCSRHKHFNSNLIKPLGVTPVTGNMGTEKQWNIRRGNNRTKSLKWDTSQQPAWSVQQADVVKKWGGGEEPV